MASIPSPPFTMSPLNIAQGGLAMSGYNYLDTLVGSGSAPTTKQDTPFGPTIMDATFFDSAALLTAPSVNPAPVIDSDTLFVQQALITDLLNKSLGVRYKVLLHFVESPL
jgi:hypothetical protein